MSIRNLLNSVRYASRGVLYVFKHEQNFRIQLLIAAIVIVAMEFFNIRRAEMIVIYLLIMLVLLLELLNSALEKFVDILKPRLHAQVEVVKDILAAMVLLVAIGSLVIGTIIFLPYLIEYMGK